ncbi:hypothetical protein C8R44DRAFT_984227 [Mycena epipterygia]|nr:hypothetical protein C8R44DRAFT_984227 [Mycena epipterygia]
MRPYQLPLDGWRRHGSLFVDAIYDECEAGPTTPALSPSSAMSAPALDGTLGALEIGTVLGTFLFGLLTLQTFNYYRQFPEDSKTLKITVAVLWVLELAQSICALYGIYNITVTNYGEPPNNFILNPPQSQILTIFFSGTIEALVQIFFGNRIRVLSGRAYIFFLCIVLAILGFVCDMILLAAFWIPSGGYAQVAAKEHWEVLTTQIVSPAGDMIIALSLCYWLWRVRDTEINRTRRMVDTLILWTCETTLVTSGAGIVQLILFLTRKDLAYIAVFLMQPKLFSNAMMASLNGRARFRFTEMTITGSTQPLEFDSRSRREEGHRIFLDTVSRMRGSVVVQIPHTTEGYNISKDKTEAV